MARISTFIKVNLSYFKIKIALNEIINLANPLLASIGNSPPSGPYMGWLAHCYVSLMFLYNKCLLKIFKRSFSLSIIWLLIWIDKVWYFQRYSLVAIFRLDFRVFKTFYDTWLIYWLEQLIFWKMFFQVSVWHSKNIYFCKYPKHLENLPGPLSNPPKNNNLVIKIYHVKPGYNRLNVFPIRWKINVTLPTLLFLGNHRDISLGGNSPTYCVIKK